MKVLSFAVLVLAIPAFAQPIVSPEVHPDGRVTFRLRAPQAREVKLQCEGVPGSTMRKDAEGIWSFTSQPLAPDIYAYVFAMDGLRVVDPNNPLLKYNLLNLSSEVHVPGPKSLAWEINDGPRGTLHHHFFKSAVAGDERDFVVYTPPGYDPCASKRYPVLYLLHGYSDDATTWTSVGCANVILDNLIARRQAKPMIVVMPFGYGTMEYARAGWSSSRRVELQDASFRIFRETLLREVMPKVERTYRILSDRKERAIAGLSMGGTESLLVGLNALDRFAWVGAFSTGGLDTNYVSRFPKLNAKANHKLHLLWLSCGTADHFFKSNQQFHEWLTSMNVRHTWVETPGAHSFRVWRRNLAHFAPLLFQEKE